MKLSKLLFKTMPILILPVGIVSSIANCSSSIGIVSSIANCSSSNGLPKVNSHRINNAFLNILNEDALGNLFYAISQYGQIEVHHFNDSKVGYINVDDYVNTLMQFEDIYGPETANYKSETKSLKTTIVNTNNNATCVIDYEKQTLTFSDYDMFACEAKAYATNPLVTGAGGGEKYYVKDGESGPVFFNSVYESGGQYVIDLRKYNIQAYYYENEGYIPYDLYRNILNHNPLSYMFYNGVNFYEVSTENSTRTTELYKDVREEATILTKEYMEHCYNLLALTFDHKFGLYERPGRSEEKKGKMIKYFPNGAYEKLQPYHDALTSLDPNVSNDAMYQFFAAECDDGGHAGYSGLDILSTKPHQTVRGPEKSNTYAVKDKIEAAREETKNKECPVAPSDYWEKTSPTIKKNFNPDDYIYVYQDAAKAKAPILYITFDSFEQVSRYSTDEATKGKVIYDNVDENNYFLDTIRMTMYANKQLKAYKDAGNEIKNIVLDLSNNGGGTVYTEHFIASWLCGGVTEKIWNPHTKSYAEYTIKADVNGDDKFTEDDYVPADTNVYCISSEMSFSCGNLLPCNLVDNRSNYTYYIGCASGGGACFVDGNMHVGLGNVFRSSSNYHILKKTSTKDNPISAESGCQPADNLWKQKINCTWEEIHNFVDRDTINPKIRGEKPW